MSFPRDRGHLSPSSYLSVLLLAAVRAYGGDIHELRFDADMLKTIEQNPGRAPQAVAELIRSLKA